MSLVCLLGLAAPSWPVAQQSPPQERALREAVEAYRSGNTAGALRMLAAIDGPRQIAGLIVKRQSAIGGGGIPGPPWAVARLRTAGALHMEAALQAYAQAEPDVSRMISQLEIGEIYLDEVGRLEQRPSDAIRWEWGIGQQALANGAFQISVRILSRGCERYPGKVALLLACGTVHETYGAFKVDIETALRSLGNDFVMGFGDDTAVATLNRERTKRSDHHLRARRAFEEVRSIDPANVEATLRLGQVRLREGDAAGARALLEPLVSAGTDLRTSYLARLLLGRTFEHQNDLVRAARTFQEAMAILPAQSVRLALTNLLLVDGDAAKAASLVQAVAADTTIEDPWWSYRFGQYWLVDPVLEALRAEARQ
jgi:hypothetical protein